MIQAVLLLSWVLLFPATAFPTQAQKGSLHSPPALADIGALPNMLFKQLFLPDAETCQHLLHSAPSLAPLPEYLSNLALELALDEVGCPKEARSLQHQLVGTAKKDIAETLLHENTKSVEEGGTGNTQVIAGDSRVDLVVPPEELRRVQRSVTLPETCKSEHSWVIYESAALISELADKLPTTDLVKEFKSTAVQVTQECTNESWERLEEVAKRVMKSPDISTHSLSLEDKIYLLKSSVSILARVILGFIQKAVKQFFS